VRRDDRTLDVELVAEGSEVLGEVFDRHPVAVDWRPASPVPTKMPVHDSVMPGEPRREIPPGKAVAPDSVSQDDRGLPFTELFVEEVRAIRRVDEAFAVVLHARAAYFLAESSGVSGISLTEGSLRISGRAIFTQR
jgi:hypothetical protein